VTRALPRLEPLRYARTGTLDDATLERAAAAFGNPDYVEAVLELAGPAMTAATAHPRKGTRP
jgi:hypothetical protein